MRHIDLAVLHCSGSAFGNAALIDAWHRQRGWVGIGYHFVILNGYPDADCLRLHRPRFDLDGAIESGRPLKRIGAHVKGHNTHSAGVCLIGKDRFTSAQFKALVELLKSLKEQHPIERIAGHYELLGAGDARKSCPNLDMDWIRGMIARL